MINQLKRVEYNRVVKRKFIYLVIKSADISLGENLRWCGMTDSVQISTDEEGTKKLTPNAIRVVCEEQGPLGLMIHDLVTYSVSGDLSSIVLNMECTCTTNTQ